MRIHRFQGRNTASTAYPLGPLDRHNQTPNPDAISFMAFFDTKEIGPIVFDTPPGGFEAALTDNIVTVWRTALKDVGLLLASDKGNRRKILS